ncbi:MAG TPA: NifU family protein [Crocinitomicaceae bacterium]|nr:NifU family protein [Crocinitomicaceae bacterium]
MNNKEELMTRIESALDEIRPYLNDDGGNVELINVTDEMIVEIKLLGACSSCNMSAMTVRAGIEGTLKSIVPEVTGVVSISAN